MKLTPLHHSPETSNTLLIAENGNRRYLVKRYEGKNAEHRRNLELHRLVRWRRAGFNVPAVVKPAGLEENAPCLAMEYLMGCSLQEFLQSKSIGQQEKFDLLRKLFLLNADRHRIVLDTDDATLIHHDLNTGNILISNDRIFYIDLEGQLESRSSIPKTDLVGIEVAKLLRWSSRDLGRHLLREVIGIMLDAYHWSKVPESIANRVYNRPFQFLHRWRNMQRLRELPGDVTKYDIADGISELVAERSERA